MYRGRKIIWHFIIIGILICSLPIESWADEEKTYVMEPIVIEGEKDRDVISDPLTESAGLKPSTTVINEAEIERQGFKHHHRGDGVCSRSMD